MKESEKILDRTFDIATEYIAKLKFTSSEFESLNNHFLKEEEKRVERRKKYKSLEDIALPTTPEPEPEPFSEETPNGTINYIMKNGVKCYASFDDMINDLPNEKERCKNIPPEDLEDIVGEIPTKEEYEKKNPPHPLVKETLAMAYRYSEDKRLCYSNNYYHMSMFDTTFKHHMEKSILSKYHIRSKTSYEVCREVVEENINIMYAIGIPKYANTDYPLVMVEECEKRIKALPKYFTWHGEGEGGWFEIFMGAYHYGQEIDTHPTMSKFEVFLRSDSFFHFWRIYCIIPYLLWELSIIVIGFSKFGGDIFRIRDWIEYELKVWINRNFVHYVILQVIIATLIWMSIFS